MQLNEYKKYRFGLVVLELATFWYLGTKILTVCFFLGSVEIITGVKYCQEVLGLGTR